MSNEEKFEKIIKPPEKPIRESEGGEIKRNVTPSQPEQPPRVTAPPPPPGKESREKRK